MTPFDRMKADVVNRQLCLGCGACAAVRPVNTIEAGEFPCLKGDCTGCGACYRSCPQLQRADVAEEDMLVAFSARARDTRIVGQDGGAVTALLASLLETGVLDCAVVVGSEPSWRPVAKVAKSPEEVMKCGRSKYSRCPVFPVLAEACASGCSMGFVGLPCQIRGLRVLQERFPGGIFSRVKLAVGLFCSSAFRYEFFTEIVEEKFGIKLEEVTKFDIDRKSVLCFTPDGAHRIPLEIALSYRAPGCRVCDDFSARYADISVGSAGSRTGMSSVVIRNQTGMDTLKIVRDALVISDDVDMDKIRRISSSKKFPRNPP